MTSCYIAKVDANGKKTFDCNDSHYVNCLIETLKKASLRGDKKVVVRCANELEHFKILCGTHPLLEVFERELKFTTSKLGLNTCEQVQRALAPVETITRSKKKYTLRGFDVYEINSDGSLSIPKPPLKPEIPKTPSECELALRNLDRKKNNKSE